MLSGALAGGRRPEAVRQHLYGPAAGGTRRAGATSEPAQSAVSLGAERILGASLQTTKRRNLLKKKKQVHSLHFVIVLTESTCTDLSSEKKNFVK